MTGQPVQWVWLARIRRPQGRKGEVFAEILTDFPEKFSERRRLWLLNERVPGRLDHPMRGAESGPDPAADPSPRQVQLVHHWRHKGGIVLHFFGVDSISDAEALAGRVVAIPREERAPLAEDEVYVADLVGCVLVDVAAAERSCGESVVVGEIQDVERDVGQASILIVNGARGEVLVPFAKSYLRKIDLDGRRVEMALPEGLAELNA